MNNSKLDKFVKVILGVAGVLVSISILDRWAAEAWHILQKAKDEGFEILMEMAAQSGGAAEAAAAGAVAAAVAGTDDVCVACGSTGGCDCTFTMPYTPAAE